MAKVKCIRCNDMQSSMRAHKLADETYVCSKCIKELASSSTNNNIPYPNINELTQETFSQWLYVLGEKDETPSMPEKQAILDSLALTKRFGNVDFNGFTHEIKMPGVWGNDRIIQFENLVNFELLEDNNSVSKGGIGRAVAGGVLFGTAGAVVGGITGRKEKKVCTSLRILLTLKGAKNSTEYIDFIRTPTEEYSFAMQSAQEVMAGLQLACEMVNSDSKESEERSPALSSADEIQKLRQLLDQGVISHEEFEAGKKMVLGL